jgi:uncharacterized protein with PIN domain
VICDLEFLVTSADCRKRGKSIEASSGGGFFTILRNWALLFCNRGGFLMQRFFTDRMLGKLAKWLRVLGYDVVYLRQAADEEIVERLREGRIFLTRGRRAGSWQQLGKVFVVNANEPKKQLREVVQGLRLAMIDAELFSRCLSCNCLLDTVNRDEVRAEVPDYIYQTQSQFHRCCDCGKVYWSGSHSEKMRQQLEEILANTDYPDGR